MIRELGVAIARPRGTQRLVLPLPTLHDIAYHQRQKDSGNGEPGMEAASLLRAVKVVSRAARHIAPKRITTFALPYAAQIT